MHSIKEIFKTGHGPSSSHSMGPGFACDYILEKYKNIKSIDVTLFGSLALTGKGHFTDIVIDGKFKDIEHKIIFDCLSPVEHPNTMAFKIVLENGETKDEKVLSIGGGFIVTEDDKDKEEKETYPHNTLTEILKYCTDNRITLVQYIRRFEDSDIDKYMYSKIMDMTESSKRGLQAEGYLPGTLKVRRKAKDMYNRLTKLSTIYDDPELFMLTCACAVSEENASGGIVVTAPTCGSSGLIPGCLAYLETLKKTQKDILDGMLVAGLIGMLCKTNASISGAECGCQAEIGVACSMGAALIASAEKMDDHKIAQAAEIAMEHSLGLTCDPIQGYVIIPCIERCGMFALKAKNAVLMASLIPSEYGLISFDEAVSTMYKTGHDLQAGYRETSKKGLAELKK